MMTKRLLFTLALLLSWMPLAQSQQGANLDAEIRVIDAPQDEAIQQRLTQVLGAIDGLDAIQIQVSAGVVTLSGNVSNLRVARDIDDIARRVEGVVYVQNRLEDDVNISARVQPLTRRFRDMSASALQTLPVGLMALAIFIVFALLGRWAGNHDAWLRRIGLSELASNLGKRIVRLVITAVGVLIALEVMDATALVGAILGIAGVAGIAVGFAFRNIVENYLAGILLSARNPFSIGDQVEVGAFNGKVMRLTSRDTVLMTRDGNHLRIPNSVIITSAMTNFTRNPLRRFEFNISIPSPHDLAQARQLGLDALRGIPGVLDDPEPQGLIMELGDSAAQLRFLAWIDQRESDFHKSRSEAIRIVKLAFDQAAIVAPLATYRVLLDNDAQSVSPPSAITNNPAPASHSSAMDTATDLSIDKQVAEELRTSDEENLLK
ncbi:BON domain-containing protein [Halopseudomonas laoshanensis]|uniref:Small-conductance mechanosensitive channel n=2 Tax=Halopseudomonas laoshanensis TaxID=2268758 RepID=A0A7V7GST1_9GAMM|nr:BON domain-containing protein [Halopseudomonas laoshanensis]